LKPSRLGLNGQEVAIIFIAFTIVAAAISYVVLNIAYIFG
jgi:archaellin